MRVILVQALAETGFFASVASYLMLDRSIYSSDFATPRGYTILMVQPMQYPLMGLRKDLLERCSGVRRLAAMGAFRPEQSVAWTRWPARPDHQGRSSES